MTGSDVATARWDGALYAENTAHHRRFDDHVLEGVHLAPEAVVLDVGCGVGDFTARLADLVPAGRVTGVDADPSMVETATASHGGGRISFLHAPVQHLGAIDSGSVDCVVSVAALHWVPWADQPLALGEIARVLRPGGLFRADLGGAGQIAAARLLLDDIAPRFGGPRSPWAFPSVAAYAPLLAGAGLDVSHGVLRLVEQRRSMPTLEALLGWLHSQVAVAYEKGMEPDAVRAFRAEVDRRAPELQRADGSYDQDYVRLDVRAVRV